MQGMPAPTEAHERLKAFVGEWAGEETMAATPWGPGGTARGATTCRAVCDGFYVTQEYRQEKAGKVSFRGHGVIGYDAQMKQYGWYWLDSMGFVPAQPAWGSWQGNRLVFESSTPHGLARYAYEFEGKDAYRFRIENSPDGGKTWQTFMTGDYRRA